MGQLWQKGTSHCCPLTTSEPLPVSAPASVVTKPISRPETSKSSPTLDPSCFSLMFCPLSFHFSFFLSLFLSEVQLIYNVVLISGVQQRELVIHTYTYFFHILFHYGLLQDIEYCSLHHTLGPFVYLFCIQQCISANSKPLIYTSPAPFPLW